MARPYQRLDAATWRQHFTSRKTSGQTVRDYCAQHGLAEQTFYRWQRALAARPAPLPADDRTPPLFVAVEVEARAVEHRLVVLLADGRRLGVAPGFDPATLAQVVAVLEGRPC
jgi:transposase-like protein